MGQFHLYMLCNTNSKQFECFNQNSDSTNVMERKKIEAHSTTIVTIQILSTKPALGWRIEQKTVLTYSLNPPKSYY